MTKTGQQIEDDVFGLLRSSIFVAGLSGDVYKFGMRPRGSELEDTVVKFVTGLPGQIQTGVVAVNIFVPDISPFDNGVLVRNISRCTQIEESANKWIESLTADKSNYLFGLIQTIYTEQEREINQHFIHLRLSFKLSTI